jgi:two-component system response regulator YesN
MICEVVATCVLARRDGEGVSMSRASGRRSSIGVKPGIDPATIVDVFNQAALGHQIAGRSGCRPPRGAGGRAGATAAATGFAGDDPSVGSAREDIMRRECILVVDDDQDFCEAIAVSLEDTYDVKQATTGVQGLGIVRRDPVAVVVLEYRLPDCTGLEMLSEIKSARPALPVIMITGYGSETICASAFKLGVRDYLPKPFSVFQLRRLVRSVLSTDKDGVEMASAARANAPGAASAKPDRSDIVVEKTAALIQQRYWEKLTLSRLAREVGVSKYRLSRRFHKTMGVTLRGYLLRARLEKAKALLATTRDHVTEIALAVGYGDLPRFDKLFKQYTGMTPSAYRKGRERTVEPSALTTQERATGT